MSGPVHTGNSLDHVEIMLGISEGPIRGLSRGLKSFYFGDTPFQDEAGNNAFNDSAVTVYPGDADPDTITLKLGGAASSTTVSQTFFANVPIIRTTGNSTGAVTALDVRIVVQQLDWKGESATGLGWILEYKRTSSPTWLPFDGGNAGAGHFEIKQLINSPTPFEWRQQVPSVIGDTWDIRCTKVSPESGTKYHNVSSWESFQEVVQQSFTFPYTAVAVMEAQATNQFSSIPNLWGVFDGLLCRVPSNYDTATRTYTGTWDGTFKIDWTDDPVWILNECVLNDRWGLNAYYPVDIDRYDLYDASANWTSVQVPDGQGGYQPRFSFSQWLTDPQPGMDFLNMIAGSFFGRVFDDGNGKLILRIDREEDPVALFTPEMVENGKFTYTYTDMTQRYNRVTALFPNPNLQWNQDQRAVEDTADQDINGVVPLDYKMPDCTNVQEAIRRALFRMISTLTEVEHVVFKTNRMASVVELFQTILIADPDMNYSLSGRVSAISEDRKTLTLRDALPLEVGITYTLMFQTPAGIIQTAFEVPSSTIYTQLELVDALDESVDVLTPFSVGNEDGLPGLPKPFRVLGVMCEQGSEDQQTITAVEINRNKYADSDNAEVDLDYVNQYRSDSTAVLPPGEISLTSRAITKLGKTHNRLVFTFPDTEEIHFSRYRAELSRNGAPPELLGESQNNRFAIVDPTHGNYTIYVYVVSTAGRTSPAVTYDFTINADNMTAQVPKVSGLEIENQGNDTNFSTNDVTFAWRVSADKNAQDLDLDADSDDDEDTIVAGQGAENGTADENFKDFELEFFDTTTGASFFKTHTKETRYHFTWAQNRKCPGGPRRKFKLGVTTRGKHGVKAKTKYITVNNPAPKSIPAAKFSIEYGAGTATVRWKKAVEPDVEGYFVWVSNTNGFTPGDATLVQDGKDRQYTISSAAGTTRYLVVAAYDRFDTSLNYSDQITLTIPALLGPDVVTGSNIADGAVTTTKLGITRETYIGDANFKDSAAWAVTGGSWTLSTTDTHITTALSAKGGIFSSLGNGTMAQAADVISTTEYYNVEPGVKYRLSADTLALITFTGRVSLRASWYDGTGTWISDTDINGTDYRTGGATGDMLTKIDGSVTAPSNAAYANFTALVTWSTSRNNTGRAYVVRPKFSRKVSKETVAENSLDASTLNIGPVGTAVRGLLFKGNSPSVNYISWSAGTIGYIDFQGNPATASILAGQSAAAWLSGAFYVYFDPSISSTTLQVTSSATTAFTSGHIVLAVYAGGANVDATFGASVINGVNIADGSIGGAPIGAGAITVSKMGVTRETFVGDANFQDAAAWNASTAGWTISTVDTNITTTLKAKGGLISDVGNGTTSQTGGVEQTTEIYVIEPGVSYRLSADVLAKSGFTGRVDVRARWYDNTGSLISQGTVICVDYRTAAAGADTQTKGDGRVVAPSNGTYANLSIVMVWSTTQNNAQRAYVVRPKFQRVISNELVETGTLDGTKLSNATVTTTQVASGTLTGSNLASATIANSNMAANSVNSTQLVSGSVTNAKIGAAAVAGSNIASGTVAQGNMASGSVGTSQLIAASVDNTIIASNAVRTTHILAGNVTSTQIASATIANSNMAANSVDSSQLVSGSVTNAKIGSAAVSGSNIASATITQTNLGAAAVGTSQLAAGAVDNTIIAAGAVRSTHIASGNVTGTHIANATVTGTNLAASSVSTSHIANSAIVASKLAVATDSMILDSEFADLNYWNIGTFTVSQDANVTSISGLQAVTGLKSSSGNGTTSQATDAAITTLFVIEPGVLYRAAVDTFVKVSFTGQIACSVRWYKQDGSLISTATSAQTDYTTIAAANDLFQTLDGQVAAPSNAHYMALRLFVTWSTTQNNNQYAYFGRPRVQRVTTSNLLAVNAAQTNLGFTPANVNGQTFTGNIGLPNGSASSPALTLGTNYGLFYNTAGSLAVSIAGTEGFRFGLNSQSVPRLSYGNYIDDTYSSSSSFVAAISGGFANNFLVVGEGTTIFQLEQYNSGNSPTFNFVKGRTSIASPQKAVLNDVLGTLAFRGNNSAGTRSSTIGASITGVLIETGTVSSTAMGSSLRFSAAPIGSGSVNEIFRLEATGVYAFGANMVIDPNRNWTGAALSPAYQRVVPTTGFSQTINNNVAALILKPAGTLATGTITMPSTPVDGQVVTISTSQTITALTLNGNTGQTVIGAITTLTAAAPASYKYVLTDASWYRV